MEDDGLNGPLNLEGHSTFHCNTCDGTGHFENDDECPDCEGLGYTF